MLVLIDGPLSALAQTSHGLFRENPFDIKLFYLT